MVIRSLVGYLVRTSRFLAFATDVPGIFAEYQIVGVQLPKQMTFSPHDFGETKLAVVQCDINVNLLWCGDAQVSMCAAFPCQRLTNNACVGASRACVCGARFLVW